METRRVQIVGNVASVEITRTKTEVKIFKEADLIKQKAYFEGMIAKGQEGLANINSLLTEIQNAKG